MTTLLGSGVAHKRLGTGSLAFGIILLWLSSYRAGAAVEPVIAWGAGVVYSNVIPHHGQSVVPPGLGNVMAIAAGGYHSLALRANGRVSAWGLNSYGQTNVPSTLTNASSIAAGLYHSFALRSNGTVSVWGNGGYGLSSVPSAATGVVAIASGWYHNLTLKSNGTVVAWGAGTFGSSPPYAGQSLVPTGLSGVAAIAAGAYHSLALRSDGTVAAWGWNAYGQTNIPAGLSNVVAIAAGGSNSLALKRDGTLVAWGANTQGQTNIPADLGSVVAVSAGAAHNAALCADGSVVLWGLNGNGQTNTPPAATNVMALAAGAYHNLALLNLGPVGFLNQPRSQTIFKGDSAIFHVGALGDAPLAYQWQFNEADLPDETSGSLVINDTQLTHSGRYRLIVSNAFGAATSSVAVLTVNDTAPFFTSPPTNQAVLIKSNALFAVAVGGVPPFSYQWRFNGTAIPGATTTALWVTNAQLANEGNYSVVASNAFGVTPSSNAFLTVVDLAKALDATNLVWITTTNPPWFPQTNVTHDGVAAASSGRVSFNQSSALRTAVAGPGTLSFWWRTTGGLSGSQFAFYVDGTNRASLMTSGWQSGLFYLDAGNHTLEWSAFASFSFVTNWLDQVSYVSGPAPATILTRPTNRTVPAGNDVTFSVSAGGTPPLSYQWQFSGVDIQGATSASLTLNNVQAANAGSYSVIVSNSYGTTNASATLTVNPSPPYILVQPQNQEMVRGGTFTFTVSARGTDPLSYQWQFNDADILGATNSSLTLSNVQTNNEGTYRVIVSNVHGTNVSSAAAFVIAPTVIVGWGSVFTSSPNPPLGTTNVAGISAGDNFSVALRTDGTLFPWGWNAFSRLNVPADLSNVVAVSAGGFHGSALMQDGTVVNWGDSFFDSAAVVPPGLSNVIDVAAGDRFNLALKRDGTVIVWGDNFLGATNMPHGLSNIVDIAGGRYHGLALKQDGTVVAWGYNSSGQTNVPAGLSNVVSIAAGSMHSIALKNDGSVVVWGNNSLGNTNVPPGLDEVVAVAAGAQHSLALRRNGTVVAWGSHGAGLANVPSWLTNVVAIAGGSSHSLALLNDGSPYITRQPWTQTLFSGMNATLELVAMGAAPLHYQWQFNGTNILGATNAMLALTNAPLSAAGDYRCVVSNSISTISTLPASLTVLRSTPQFVPRLSGFAGDGSFRLYFDGLSGHGEIILHASTNLIDWQPILTNPPALGALLMTDYTATNSSRRFYWMEER